jgi:hypothetical protein
VWWWWVRRNALLRAHGLQRRAEQAFQDLAR